MSTRATIARQTEGNAFIGRYSHYDGYPSGVGTGILKALSHFGITKGKKVLLDDHPAGWSNIASCDWTQEIGFIEALDSPYMDRPQCYCHGDRNEEEWIIDSAGDDGGTEWAYVFHGSNTSLMVYERKYKDDYALWELQKEIDLTSIPNAMSEMIETCPTSKVPV